MGCIFSLFKRGASKGNNVVILNSNENLTCVEILNFLEKLRNTSTLNMIHRPSQLEYRKLNLIERLMVLYKE